MAKSKFSDIYKQELNSKGVMSSLGSAALKQTRERMDIRNSLFGGTGAISRTGQKIFGKGYSAMGGNAAKLSGSSNSPMQGASIDALVISNQKQERLLKIVAKNTMNMNMMARDMNITRQNIVSLTRKVTGKSAKGSDAMYMNANRRNAQVDGMPKRGAAPGASGGIMSSIFGGIGSVLSGGAGIIGSVVSGLLGIVGGVGGGILSAIGGILGGIPGGWLLGTIALAGMAYLLKEVAENTNFKGLKDDILKGLGLNPDDKENTLTKQILEKIGFSKETAKKIDDSLSDFGGAFKDIFEPVVSKMLIYSKAAFNTLTSVFSILGEEFKYQVDTLFNENRGAIFAAMALGYMGPTALLAPKLSAAIAAMAAGFGALSGQKNIPQLQSDVDDAKKQIDIKTVENEANQIKERVRPLYPDPSRKTIGGEQLKSIMQMYEEGGVSQIALSGREQEMAKLEIQRIKDSAELKLKKDLQEKSKKRQNEITNIDKTIKDLYEADVKRGMDEYNANKPKSKNSNSPIRIPQSLLDIIGEQEGGAQGYEATNKGKAGDNNAGRSGLTQMTVGEVMAAQAKKEFVAAGKYQIIPTTLKDLVDKKIVSKGDKFNKETQDKLATALIDEALKRAGSDTKNQQYELAKIFAAIADPNTGESYHKDVGNNKSSITTEQIQPILKNSGANISSSSIQLTDERLVQALNNSGQGSETTNNTNITNVAGSSGSRQYSSAFSSDAAELFINKSFAVTA